MELCSASSRVTALHDSIDELSYGHTGHTVSLWTFAAHHWKGPPSVADRELANSKDDVLLIAVAWLLQLKLGWDSQDTSSCAPHVLCLPDLRPCPYYSCLVVCTNCTLPHSLLQE